MKPCIVRMSPYWACGTPALADWMPGLTPWAAFVAWKLARAGFDFGQPRWSM